ncbi:gamma-glutamylcyclotransferase-like [Salmo salar]|uniref:Gamma-glutamylcyclotransferase-like n=1 Tax=Salmo salar TaxID=8030 RepID=A0A1S3NI63_SALSA|nr:gamma-glutamylcyclotransferase-like [Salmo salar]
MTSPCVSAPPPSTLADCGFSLFSPPCLPLTPPPPPHPALLLLLLSVSMDENIETHTFLYFAYGSNLLKERLQLKNPSASIHCVTRLKDYKLIFGNYKGLASDRWHGGVATIENSPADEVWEVVWRMNVADLESLDR